MWKPSLAPPIEAIWSQALAQHHDENVAGSWDKACQQGQSKRDLPSPLSPQRQGVHPEWPYFSILSLIGKSRLAGNQNLLPAEGKTQGQFIPERTQTGVNLDLAVSIIEATPQKNRKSSPREADLRNRGHWPF